MFRAICIQQPVKPRGLVSEGEWVQAILSSLQKAKGGRLWQNCEDLTACRNLRSKLFSKSPLGRNTSSNYAGRGSLLGGHTSYTQFRTEKATDFLACSQRDSFLDKP